MLSKKWSRIILTIPLSISFFAQAIETVSASDAGSDHATVSVNSNGTGKWMSGEFHVHTFESDDAQDSLENVLNSAFDKYGFDWIATNNHLRSSSRDDEGDVIAGGPIPFSKGAIEYEVPKIKELQANGRYVGKTIFSGFEWDMPSHEHVSIGILGDAPNSESTLKAANQFEYLFTNRDANMFDSADVAVWNQADQRAFTTHADALQAIQWLKNKYEQTSYVILNHPSRIVGKYTIADIRDLNNLAPDIVFGMEGMIGGQMEPDRGGYNTTYDTSNPTANSNYKNRSYGGTDYMVSKVGGVWDSLLGEGRRFWNFANSDFHFKTRGPYSSGYWPGEYSKNYTWTEGSDMQSILNGLRSGKSFSAYGDLINALDFNAVSNGVKEDMGGDLKVMEGDDVQITVRFKSPSTNNYESQVDSGIYGNTTPEVDHVDLIAGDVTGKAKQGTDAYNKDTNESTKVIATFTSKDWTTDSEGYNVINYTVKSAEKNQYFRLRGTNLGINVEGETKDGNPLLDPITIDVNPTDPDKDKIRFNAINDRNYSDLWFYSNPIFVSVAPNDQAVEDAKNSLVLGDLSSVTADIPLPLTGEKGTSIQWTSSDASVISNTGKLESRPANNTLVTLKATISRGNAVVTKSFLAVIQGINPATVELRATMTTDDGLSYTSDTWTNQNVTASVYADLFAPSSMANLELSLDGGLSYEVYNAHDALVYNTEGEHQLLFRATDDLNHQTYLPIVIKIDKTLPVIKLVGEESVTLTVGNTYKEQGATITDSVGIPGEIIISGDVNNTIPGAYTVHYNAKDAAGNQALEVKRSVIVKEKDSTTPPSGGGSNSGNTGTIPSTPTPSVPVDKKSQPSTSLDLSPSKGLEGSIPDVVQWSIPQGTVESDSKLNFSVLAAEQVPSTGALKAISPVVSITSTSGRVTYKPMNMTLHYDAKQLTIGQNPAIYYYNTDRQSWVYLGGKITSDGTVTVDTKHFDTYAVFGSEPVVFSDMNGHWGSSSIERLAGMNVIRGYDDSLFHPNAQVTRVQFASMLAKSMGLEASNEVQKFTDASQIPTWGQADVASLVQAGFISGYSGMDGLTFKPNQVITRAEMATMLGKVLKVEVITGPTSASVNTFQDASSIPDWAGAEVNSLVESGIIQGYGDQTFRLNTHATRAEAATMLYKLLDALNI